MKQKFFAIAAIAVLAILGVFIFEYATLAQRPDRNAQNQQRGNRQGGERGGRGMQQSMINPVSWINDSWVDLTFTIKVDDESLVKARPVYQAARDKFAAKMEELQASGDRQAAMAEMQSFTAVVGKEFTAGLQEALTKEQAAKVTELIKKRQTEQQQQRQRMRNRFRGGGGAGGGGAGGGGAGGGGR